MRESKCTIIGSGKHNLPIGVDGAHTYRLNYAAIKTVYQYGFTGHDAVIKFYEENSIRFIAVTPTFEGSIPVGYFDSIKSGNSGKNMDDDIKYFIKMAINNRDIPYPCWCTVLHLAIFYCLKNGYKEIDLFGCQHDYDLINDPEYLTSDHVGWPEQMRKYTGKLVELSKPFGITINWNR